MITANERNRRLNILSKFFEDNPITPMEDEPITHPQIKGNVMTWNHRVIRTKAEISEYLYNIYEVHYDVNGVPHISSRQPVYAQGDSSGLLYKEIKLMLEACNKPVLEWVGDELVEVE